MLVLLALGIALFASGCASTAPGADPGAPPADGGPGDAMDGAMDGAMDDGGEEGEESDLPTVAEATEGLEHREGLLDLWIDAEKGKVWMEVPAVAGSEADLPAGSELDWRRGEVGRYLLVEGLLTGLGSNPVGLDRGQLGNTHVMSLRRVGGRVLFELPNLRYRALTEDPLEARAVRESFATSILWAGDLAALDTDGDQAGRGLVDLTPFLLRDTHGIVRTLKYTGQGSYSFDRERSVVDPDACLAFPENLELEALLTYSAAEPGRLVADTAPLGDIFTVVQHVSLVALPDDGYTPRPFDPRMGSNPVTFHDYAAGLDEPLEKRWVVRHRLEKVDPTAPVSKAVEPLVYYVDPGTPEPVRSALIEGASWWAEAFRAAGFEDGYRVELLPPDAHPLDVRYNVIQWVHRSTRGWSYGGGVVDPRTGELIKGHVTLGSLRVRQDRRIFEGLLGTGETGTGSAEDPIQLSLARIRQLSAHEVGHTLGLTHNFAASTYGRESVMDYPAPWVRVGEDGELDVSAVYDTGMGDWDVWAIRWAYSQFPPGSDEAAELEAIVRDGQERGLAFLADADARPPGAAHPAAGLWDNWADPIEGLEETLKVRQIALSRFGRDNLPAGEPQALLEEVLAPIYFYHRYQVEAAAKVVAGVEYEYAVNDPAARTAATPVPAEAQRLALDRVLETLEPQALDLPEEVLELLVPRPFGYDDNRELFSGRTGLTFDPLGAAEAAAALPLAFLFHPERALRLVDQSRRDPGQLSLEAVLIEATNRVFPETPPAPRRVELQRIAQTALVSRLMELAASADTAPSVAARVDAHLAWLSDRLQNPGRTRFAESVGQRRYLRGLITRHLERPAPAAEPAVEAPPPPPGSPIGSAMGSARGSGMGSGPREPLACPFGG